MNNKLKNVMINDNIWNKYISLVRSVILPFQWDLINDNVPGAEKSYCMRNFRVANGLEKGSHMGAVFQDTDVAKWLEAVGFSVAADRNDKLEGIADEAIKLISGAQCKDGYVNTYYTIENKKRWGDLFEGHELYTAGHLIEAAVSYYNATKKREILDVACRCADNICSVFGPEEGKNHGYPGHPEIELALVKLYRLTGKKQYLKMADFFVRSRGKQPCCFADEENYKTGELIFPEFKDFDFDYCQADKPVSDQDKAEGHAVRAMYLYSAMADLAYEEKDERLKKQCEVLWKDVTEKQMYVTGSVGSAAYGERFTTEYDLPNNTNYSESCATVGLAMFSDRMFRFEHDGKYMDIVEKALYNTLLAGIALDGKHFFYVNPLEVAPGIAEKNPTMRHIMTTRQLWFGVACCPPNIARTLASMQNYLCDIEDNTYFLNLFIAGRSQAEFTNSKAEIVVEADYPVSGNIRVTINPELKSDEISKRFSLAIRKPAYSQTYSLFVNGQKNDAVEKNGYLYLNRDWQIGDVVEYKLDVSFRYVFCDPRVRDNIGKVCIMRGPWVYCLEEVDNGNYLAGVELDVNNAPEEQYDESLFGGTLCSIVKGKRIDYDNLSGCLYSSNKPEYKDCSLRAIPYCYWNNRGKGEMMVWMKTKDS
ncbi:MAG: beta-L-arabinofuranosidase domain-containing protein [Lachnospiraceae bacterium]|nr:glycoside hydrolase family 127 protein [Lachnospiraceae bacterium]